MHPLRSHTVRKIKSRKSILVCTTIGMLFFFIISSHFNNGVCPHYETVFLLSFSKKEVSTTFYFFLQHRKVSEMLKKCLTIYVLVR